MKIFFFQQKQISLFLNIWKNLKNHFLKKSEKITFFQQQKMFKEEQKIAEESKFGTLSFSILGGRDSTRALQSSPFQNPEPDEG